jgi:transcriptional regulator with XRE-family HTH domain
VPDAEGRELVLQRGERGVVVSVHDVSPCHFIGFKCAFPACRYRIILRMATRDLLAGSLARCPVVTGARRAGDSGVRAMYEEGIIVSEDVGRNPRQVFGAMVRFYREKAGLSRPELGRRICKSAGLVEAIELGRRPATATVAMDLEAALDAGGALVKLREEMRGVLSTLAFPAWFQDWALKEAEATTVRWFEPLVVPGLLQTEEYARAIFRARLRIAADELDELVTARMKRQEILTRDDPPTLWVILDEWVLRRPVGSPSVMLEQLSRLVEWVRQPQVVIEVLPATLGAREGLNGAFALADFKDGPTVGYHESTVGGQLMEQPNDVALLGLTWDTVRMDTLPRAASLAALEEAAKSWTTTL